MIHFKKSAENAHLLFRMRLRRAEIKSAEYIIRHIFPDFPDTAVSVSEIQYKGETEE